VSLTRRRAQKGSTLAEFAVGWPVALLIVLAAVETAVWGSEAYAARAAALAGARAGSVSGGTATVASAVALRSLAPSLVGVTADAWCPGQSSAPPPVWVCATDLGASMQVDVGGSVPALVPLWLGPGLPLHAHVVLQKEAYAR
jgi:hypothetical protein